MKTISTIIISCLLFTGCNSALNLEPITEQTEVLFYRTESDAFQALVAAYDVLQWSAPRAQNSPFEMVGEQIGDCCYGGGGNANDVPSVVRMSRWQMDANDGAFDALWYKYYFGIFRANILLSKIPNIPFKNEKDRQRIVAEAHFLRANYYFDLVRLFGNVPLILTPIEPSEYYSQMQEQPAVIYGQIKDDLVFAIENGLPNRTNIPASETGRISKHAAEALLARVWLYYTGAYQQDDLAGLTKTKVIEYIEDVVNGSGSDLLDNYADIFKTSNKNNKESIFEIQYTSASKWANWNYREGSEGNQAIILWGLRSLGKKTPYAPGWSFAPVRASLWDDFDPSDPRRELTLVNMELEGYTSKGSEPDYFPGFQNTGIFNKKYTALNDNEPTGGGSRELNFPNNYICIRFADVLLMAAELQLDVNAAKAQTYYNRVVKRAMGEAFSVPALSRGLLMKERLLELALEGHRYWDLRRQGLVVAKSVIEKENSSVTDEFKKTFDTKYKGLMPIPQSQLLLCKQLIQNEGY